MGDLLLVRRDVSASSTFRSGAASCVMGMTGLVMVATVSKCEIESGSETFLTLWFR
jgi:hypothetical protein